MSTIIGQGSTQLKALHQALENMASQVSAIISSQGPILISNESNDNHLQKLVTLTNSLLEQQKKQIHDLKQANQQLQENCLGQQQKAAQHSSCFNVGSTLLQSLLQSSPDSIVVTDAEGTLLNVSESCEKMFGYHRDELLGQNASLLAPGQNGQHYQGNILDELLADSSPIEPKTHEVRGRHKDGTLFPATLTFNSFQYNGQRCYLGMIHDSSEPVRLRAFYRALAGVGEAGRLVHEESDFLEQVVERVATELRLPAVIMHRYIGGNELESISIAGSLAAQVSSDNTGKWKLCALTQGAIRTSEVQACSEEDEMSQSGHLGQIFMQYHFKSLAVAPVHRHQQLWGLLVVSAREPEYFGAMEKELLRRVGDLVGRQLDEYDAHQALAAARREAERANRAKSEFLTRMSHELRTPMNAIMGFAQLLESKLEDEQEQNFVGQILKAGHHLVELINEALYISRIEAGRLSLSIEPLDLNHLLIECRDLISPQSLERSIWIDLVPTTAKVMVDSVRCKQVILNLLANAVNYNHDGGMVRIEVINRDGMYGVAVKDSGPGIAHEDMNRLFEPFERLGREHTPIEGTGIGLALSRRLTELMHGRLEAASQIGMGSTFTAWFPAANSTDIESVQHINSESEQQQTLLTQNQQLLYVEDNPANLQVIRAYLNHFTGARMDTATSAEEAWERLQNERPDLILLDIHLPGMDGIALLKLIRQHEELRNIPVVVLSADAMDHTIQRAHEAGASAYLSKPLNFKKLSTILQRHLEYQQKSA